MLNLLCFKLKHFADKYMYLKLIKKELNWKTRIQSLPFLIKDIFDIQKDKYFSGKTNERAYVR